MEAKQAVFSFDDMIASLRRAMVVFPDERTGKNTQYEVMDAASGAFSVFFTQSPSFLSHQKLMQEKHGLSNAKTLFGMRDIPSDNHIRNLLDAVDPSLLKCVFQDCFAALDTSGHLDTLRVKLGKNKNDLLVAIDGTEHFSSDTIHCANCTRREKFGKMLYSHSVVTPTVVAPGINKVISLMPEFVVPQDGVKKQDCELNAGKRILARRIQEIQSDEITILGDDLYAHEPFCLDVLGQKYNFILVCKPESHKTIYEWIEGSMDEKRERIFDGKEHQVITYKYMENVPMRDGKDALLVNFVEVIIEREKDGKQLYHNAFITNHELTEKTLPLIVSGGRARWKIENENNNTLKRQGYNLEHNFGHGKKHLASLLAAMNILAFLFHTMLEFMNEKYQLLRLAIGARKRFFEHIRVLLTYIPARSFDHFMSFMITSLKNPVPLDDLKFPV
jgi:hypothetical protein